MTRPPARPDDAAAPAPAGIAAATYLPELESLRGIAIILVYAFHTDGLVHFLMPDRPLPALPLALVRGGNTGVDLFFVLSGFLLGLPFVHEAHGGRRVDLGRYFARRALRILPLYWTAVLVVTAVTAVEWRDLGRALPYLAFLNMILGLGVVIFPYSTPWWSLGTEVEFYLGLPLVRAAFRPGLRRTALLAGLGLWAVAYLAGLVHATRHPGDVAPWVWASLYGRLPGFLLGVGLAWLHAAHGAALRRRLGGSTWLRRGGADVVFVGVVALLCVVLRDVVRVGFATAEVAPYQVYHVATSVLWTAVVALVLLAPLRLRPLLHNRALVEIGVLSYSIYLWHVPIVHGSLMALRQWWPFLFHRWDLPTTAGVIGITVLTLGASAVSYRVVERPFLTYKARLR